MIKDTSVLIVIDVQNDFVNEASNEFEALKVVKNSMRAVEIFREKNLPVIFTKEVHYYSEHFNDFGRLLDGVEPAHVILGTEGVNLHKNITPLEDEIILDKSRYSCFFQTNLDLLLKSMQVDTIYITGFLTDVCVRYTAVDAHQLDYFFHIIEDACGGSEEIAHESAIASLQYLQRNSIVSINELK